jgi:hypothetical protein
MAQSRQHWHSDKAETAWLAMLVEMLERLSDPKERAVRCDAADLIAAKAHLARPGCHGPYGSHLSFRN